MVKIAHIQQPQRFVTWCIENDINLGSELAVSILETILSTSERLICSIYGLDIALLDSSIDDIAAKHVGYRVCERASIELREVILASAYEIMSSLAVHSLYNNVYYVMYSSESKITLELRDIQHLRVENGYK